MDTNDLQSERTIGASSVPALRRQSDGQGSRFLSFLPVLFLARLLPVLPFLSPLACGSGAASPASAAPPGIPAAKPQIVYTGPGVPGTVSAQELFVANFTGAKTAPISQDHLNKFLAHFSPDGNRLLYTKFLSGKFGDVSPVSDIFVYNFATSTETRLTYTGTAIMATWSPDGKEVAFGTYDGTGLFLINSDGTGQHMAGHPTGAIDDLVWHDFAWSSDNWIYFVVEQTTGDCLKVRLDKVRPDGSSRTQVSNGGPNCTPPNMEPYGDADPGISADGQTVYSSRGLSPLPADPRQTLRHLYAYSSGAYTPGKVEEDLSIASKPECTVGVPKGSPDGQHVLVFLFCPDDLQHLGVTLTDPRGSSWTFLTTGFGPDWNPATRP